MRSRDEVLGVLRDQKLLLLEIYHVTRIGVFGSYTREEQTDDSDVDLVVEFDRPIGLRFVDLCDYLEECLGKRVDVLTLAGVAAIRNRAVAESIMRSLIYV